MLLINKLKKKAHRQKGHLNSVDVGTLVATCCLSFLSDQSLSSCKIDAQPDYVHCVSVLGKRMTKLRSKVTSYKS